MKHVSKMPAGELHWGWKTAILIVGTILLGIILNTLLMTALTMGYVSQGLSQALAVQQAADTAGGFLAQVVVSVIQLGLMIWLVWWLVEKIERQKFEWSKLGLGSTDRSKYILPGILFAATLSLLTIGVGYVSGTLKYLGNGIELFALPQVAITLFLTTILSFASGFGEEVAFRGYLQSRLAQRYNPTTATVIVAVLFAFLHPFGNASNPLLYLVTAILVGILFGAVFVRTGSLWMGIALHAVWNYLQIAIVAVRSAPDERFFGAPLFVFESVSGTLYMFTEFTVIFAGVLFTLWILKPFVRSSREKSHEIPAKMISR